MRSSRFCGSPPDRDAPRGRLVVQAALRDLDVAAVGGKVARRRRCRALITLALSDADPTDMLPVVVEALAEGAQAAGALLIELVGLASAALLLIAEVFGVDAVEVWAMLATRAEAVEAASSSPPSSRGTAWSRSHF